MGLHCLLLTLLWFHGKKELKERTFSFFPSRVAPPFEKQFTHQREDGGGGGGGGGGGMKERGAGLVGCFGFNCPLRQYFSLYWAGKQEREWKASLPPFFVYL